MVSNPTSDELALKALTECKNLQFLIDANRKHLDKLRAPTLSKRGHFTPTSGNNKLIFNKGEITYRFYVQISVQFQSIRHTFFFSINKNRDKTI